MASFNKKNKDILSDLPKPNFNLPKFPDLPSKKETFQEYKPIIPSFSDIKFEVNKPKPILPSENSEIEEFNFAETFSRKGTPINKENEELFVKVEKYEQAMKVLSDLKDSFKKTEDILKSLQTIKSEEDKEINKWTSEIQRLKNKVISIDSTLFGSKK